MMALLLTFFILLFSMSEIEVEKFREAAKSLHEGFGSSTVDLGDSEPVAVPEASDSTGPGGIDGVDEQLDEIANALETFAVENGLENSLLVERNDEGVYLRINDAALFQAGFADVEPDRRWIIEKLSLITKAVDFPVNVAGHSDNTPINNARYRSNWELSAARAAGVARALVDLGHDPAEVQVTAFGEYRPIASNETPEGRSRNRRVDLFYSRQTALEARLAEQNDSTAAAEQSPADST
jgi:chemotaxis protein MotB